MIDKGRIKRAGGIVLLAVLLLLVGSIAGCGGADKLDPEPAPPIEEKTLPDPEPVPIPEPEPAPAFTAPLTGLPLEKEAAERPIAVMINNMGQARPQSGLPHADMVWEVLAEGGITRLVAIFQSDGFKDPIGPIRSNRPYLIEIGDTFNAILAHAGASTEGYDILQHQGKAYLDEISNAGSYFWREKFRKAPHNLYSSIEKLRAGAARKKYKDVVAIPAYPFSDVGATIGGITATKVDIHFLLKNYKVSYVFDEVKKLYFRSINDKPHTDLTTEEQLAAANLAVIGTKHRTYDDYGRLEVDLKSGGPAVLIQLGQAVECSWVRADDGAIRLMKDGRELPFVPGKTFYHIVPLTPSFGDHLSYS
ncbi:DUF3048 domain-containing protein [Paenibacillus nasutitermitis]|uniref:Lipoprotein YerB n=1 Tax=Paenibacillus nasutitermitis TaxID=1652958 RepID=A0A916ZCI9_9BACL|nr:DUF3048 domain-containing protein [Paenibacillus nasutitermitis]GGD88122.1 putative lipoprotein YerB [Paenibacillus nasutitermitis]